MAKNQKVTALKNKVEEVTNQLKRALADYSNLEKRLINEKEEFVKFANLNLVLKILPILDGLEKAAASLNNEGLNLVLRQFKNVLDSEGVKEVSSEVYDPNKQEAIELVEGEEEGLVVEVVEKGYELNGRVIKPSRVKVMRKEVK